MTLKQVLEIIEKMIVLHGESYPIRVNTTYDQGMPAMAITGIIEDNEYVGIEA